MEKLTIPDNEHYGVVVAIYESTGQMIVRSEVLDHSIHSDGHLKTCPPVDTFRIGETVKLVYQKRSPSLYLWCVSKLQ